MSARKCAEKGRLKPMLLGETASHAVVCAPMYMHAHTHRHTCTWGHTYECTRVCVGLCTCVPAEHARHTDMEMHVYALTHTHVCM